MEENAELRATTTMASEAANTKTEAAAPNRELQTVHSNKSREEGELSSSDGGDGNPDSSAVQSTPAAESNEVPLVQKSTQGVQGGSNNEQLQATQQSTTQKTLIKNQLPPKSSPWNGHVDTDKNLVISFSDDDSGSDFDTNGNASRLESNVKRPSPALVKSNKSQLQQNGRSVNKAMPNRLSSNHTFISPITKNYVSNSKGAGSVSLGQGLRARYFNPINKKIAIRERGLEQGVVSNDSKLQDLRHQIALRENELKLKAAQLSKESASVLARDHNALNLKNVTARKFTHVSSEAAQLEPKEPDRKRMKLATSYGTPQAVNSQQEIPASKSILPPIDSALGNYNPLERNNVDHCQKAVPLCRGEPTTIRSQRKPEKHHDNSLQNMACRSRDGDVNYDRNQTEMRSRLVDPCIAFNQSAVPVPPNLTSNSIPKDVDVLSNAVLLNYSGNAKELTDLDSFFGMEEMIDKELEEAQELRHKCEVEERNALRVYLKAQRSLLEANAQCTNLYRKREMHSAKLRSLILNNSNLTWSAGQHQQLDIGLDFLPRHGYEIPTSSCQRLPEYNDINNPSFDSNNQGINNGRSNTSYHRVTGENFGSEPCGEPDASTSEPLPQMVNSAANDVSSPSDESDISANENEENSPAGHVSNNIDADYHTNQGSETKYMDIDTASNSKLSADHPQDSLLLEATLRSELVARLGARTMKTCIPSNNIDPAAERGAENDVRSEKNLEHHGVVPPSREDDQGIEKQGRSIQSQQNIGRNSLDSNCNDDSGDQGHMPCSGHQSTNTVNIPPLIFKSAFSELREMSSCHSNQYQNKNKFIHATDSKNEGGKCLSSDKMKLRNMLAISMPVTVGSLLSEESSYSCSPVVDPFWPLCMFELRGKCNNDECPWQHVKDCSDGKKFQHPDSNDAEDCQGRLSSHQQNCNGDTKVAKCHKAPIPPTYLVGLYVLKADQFAYKPVVAHRNTHCWQKYFSITFTTSNHLRSGLPADAPLVHNGDERIEVHGLWNKQLSSFQWRSGAGNQIKQAMADSEQAVEMALLVLNQEINKLQGARKALCILSKALETDPISEILWIVYLLIYYGTSKPNEKNDMFLCAVKHCEQSYILWLMYINSQRKLDDRLAAYDAAFSALCCNASSVLKDRVHDSACILDLFLQMLDCLCMSGNVEKAINRSYGILPATTKSNEPHHLSLSDILNCLTISDKCVFWVCCVYLVIYRKLPDAVVQKFECEKELLDIEWPFIPLLEDDMEMAVEVVETAVESVDSCLSSESVKSDVNLRSAQIFALNHIRCMVALDRLECSRNLLDKYMKLYPSCLELGLVSARIGKHKSSVDHFMGFEEAISRWPNEFPGIHCIWNQFIENEIQNQRIDFAKEITARWFHSVWEPRYLQNGVGVDAIDGGNSCGSLGLNLKTASDALSSEHKQMDMMFGFINLSLYNIFQNDVTEACVAVDKARNVAGFGGLEPCIRKHAMFVLCDALSLKEDSPNGAMNKILDIYTDNSSQTFLVPKVLTRKFVDNIKKPRVQHLISNILTPVSFDCSLLNLIILQSWNGSSLTSLMAGDPKHLVDFVEAIMEVVPNNYELAITVCKQLSKSYNSSDLNCVSLWFWACSNLVNAVFDSIPIPPEYVWVEAGEILHNAMGVEAISERFYRRALSVYPFSNKLWKCFCRLRKTIGEAIDVVEAANERGIELD